MIKSSSINKSSERYNYEIKCPYCGIGIILPMIGGKESYNLDFICFNCKVVFVIKKGIPSKQEVNNPTSRRYCN